MGHTAFVLLLLTCGSVVADAANAPAAPASIEAFATYGFSIPVPAGFKADDEEPAANMVGSWAQTRIGPGKRELRTELYVVAEPAGGWTVKQLADAQVKAKGGRVDPKPATLDGLPAAHVILLLKPDRKQRIEQILCVREGVFFMLAAATEPGDQPGPTLEAARAGWKWTAIDPPSRHLDVLRKGIAFADGSAIMDYPAVMRPYPFDQAKLMQWQAVSHVPKAGIEFVVEAETAHVSETTDMAELRDRVGADHAQHSKWPDPPQWTVDPGSGDHRWRTQWEPTKVELAKGASYPAVQQWAFMDLGHGLVVSLGFLVFDSAGPAARDAYEQAAAAIRQSVRSLVSDGFARYTSPDGSLAINYPKSWRAQSTPGDEFYLAAFYEKRTPPIGKTTADLFIHQPTGSDGPLDRDIDLALFVRRQAGDVQVLSNESARVGGQKGWCVVFDEVPKNAAPVTEVFYYFDANERRYEIGFSVSPEQYGWIKPILDQIASSLHVQ